MGKKRRLLDEYQFPGFRPRSEIQGIFGDPKARVIRLERTEKKRHAEVAARCIAAITTRLCDGYGIYLVEMPGYIWKWKSAGFGASGVGK
jgi:hypothetical protein